MKRKRYLLSASGDEITDKKTGLIWKRCLCGQVWDGKACVGEIVKLTWQEAIEHAIAQPGEWRLPTLGDFNSIRLSKPEHGIFISNEWVWTSTRFEFYDHYIWIADVNFGCNNYYWEYASMPIRLVRG